jgi:cytoskeletal protein RodZ
LDWELQPRHIMDGAGRLRAAREQAGLSLEAIAERTKIRVSTLRAIERGDLSGLPGPFYARAFVRTYARELGLPADELERELAPAPEPLPTPIVSVQHLSPVHRMAPIDPPRTYAWQLLPLALVVFVAIFALNRSADEAGDVPEPGAVGTAGQVTPAVTRAGGVEKAVTAADDRGAATSDLLSIEVRATAAVWVAASADGRRVIYRLMQQGDREVVQARDEITLRVGDAAALTYSVHGAAGRAFGAPGEVRDVRITRANLATFQR